MQTHKGVTGVYFFKTVHSIRNMKIYLRHMRRITKSLWDYCTLVLELCAAGIRPESQHTVAKKTEHNPTNVWRKCPLSQCGNHPPRLEARQYATGQKWEREKADFYCSRSFYTVVYLVPEILLRDTFYNESIDIWSIGCTILELRTGSPTLLGLCLTDHIDIVANLFS